MGVLQLVQPVFSVNRWWGRSAGPSHYLRTIGLVFDGALNVRKCEGLRMPAMTTARHTPTAGVRKWPRDEIAGRGR